MGGSIVRRLLRAGHDCVVWDRDPGPGHVLANAGAVAAQDVAGLVAALTPPRHVWIMLPAGEATESMIATLSALLSAGDTVIDGGNTFWKDDIRRAAALAERGLHYVDVGASGGVWGLERGYCMMIGGEPSAVERLDPVFASLAPGVGDVTRTPGRDGRDARVERGYLHAGPTGAGHFVKMIHNGIEYGMMQAMAEGFDILSHASSPKLPEHERLALDVADIAEVWRRGSVITSWLLDLTAEALARDPALDGFSGHVSDSGEGRWTVEAAIERDVPAEVLTSRFTRGFARARTTPLPRKCCRRCAKRFAATPNPRAEHAPSGPRRPGWPAIVVMGVRVRQEHDRRRSKKLGWPFRDADSFHPPANVAKMSAGVP
jgi:6-phosphogluconate dehydrogenase